MSGDAPSAVVASRRAHRNVQWILRGGLILSSTLIAVGLIVALVSGEPGGQAVRLAHLFTDASVADRLIALGFAVMALTPPLRVVALIAIWLREHDHRFVAVAVLVSIILAIAIFSGT